MFEKRQIDNFLSIFDKNDISEDFTTLPFFVPKLPIYPSAQRRLPGYELEPQK